jgi:plastocyanin
VRGQIHGVVDLFCKYHAALGMRGRLIVPNAE